MSTPVSLSDTTPLSMPQGLIATAAGDAWIARATGRLELARRFRARARLQAIDDALEYLEQRHLQGERTYDRLTHARMRRLERQVGLPLPRKVVRARNTARLHAALLDWQEQVLDEVAPQRRAFEDVYDADWNAATPSYADAS